MSDPAVCVNDNLYTPDFFRTWANISRRSAEVIVPVIMEMFHPRTVVDVGCAIGTWLSVFKAHGVGHVLGIDGDYVDTRMLVIPRDQFLASDLRKPLQLHKTFDLVLSVEVAEHLPPECADTFVETLVRLAPVVVFSAAVPFQGGLSHVNEQWPNYWVTRFRKRGFVGFDALRRKIWQDDAVEWWYAQNIFVFVNRNRVNDFPALAGEPREILPLVHPKNYEGKTLASMLADPSRLEARKVLKAGLHMAFQGLKRRFQEILHLSRSK